MRNLVLFLLLGPVLMLPQETRQPNLGRPTIGVALEGGGAKGLAHVGVLQWFEDHHIPVDYIAGTSMGGLVGGLYAAGLRAADIRKIVGEIQWNEVLAGQTSYRALSFRRKEDYRTFPNRLEFGLRGGLSLPGGLSSGQAVRVLLDRYMLPYSEPKSFDDLPIPFRCVATDLVTGKEEVFANGSVASALRATMSIPGVFAPVKTRNSVYADGGLLNNLPTDVVKTMGADVVIGVHLSVGQTDPTKLRSMFEVAGGATGVMIDANVLRGMERADLLLTVDVAGYSTIDFSRVELIIAQGYKAAEKTSRALERFALSDEDWKRHLARREARRVQPNPTIQFVEVEGISRELGGYVSQRLSQYVGAPMNPLTLESELETLVGLGRFDSLTYSLTRRENETGLLITAEEKSYSPPWLKPGFVIDGADPDNVIFGFAGRVTFLDVGGFRSEARIDFAIGSAYTLRAEYYRPFHPLSRWFVAPRLGIDRIPLNLYAGNNLVADYRLNSAYGGVDVGYNFDRFSELRFGYQVGYSDAHLRIGSPAVPSISGRTGLTRLRYAMDRLDNPIIPRSGIALLSNVDWIDSNPGSEARFPAAETTILGLSRLSAPASVYGIAAGGTTFGNYNTGLPRFALGGPSRFAAYGLNEFLANQYVYGRVGYLHQIGELPTFLGRGVYLDAHGEIGKVFRPVNLQAKTSQLPADVVVGLVTETIFGPLVVGGSVGASGHGKWFFQLGKIF